MYACSNAETCAFIRDVPIWEHAYGNLAFFPKSELMLYTSLSQSIATTCPSDNKLYHSKLYLYFPSKDEGCNQLKECEDQKARTLSLIPAIHELPMMYIHKIAQKKLAGDH